MVKIHYYNFMLKQNENAELRMLKVFGRRPACSTKNNLPNLKRIANVKMQLVSNQPLLPPP